MACAVNGILEAYMFAVMTTEELNQHNSTLLIFSILFIFGTVTLGKMYLASGLLYAQVLNMLLRPGFAKFTCISTESFSMCI